jgi:hypothetical protein
MGCDAVVWQINNDVSEEPVHPQRLYQYERCHILGKSDVHIFLCSWDLASSDIEVVYMTNKMRQIHNIYCCKCSTCFGPSLPIIRSSELHHTRKLNSPLHLNFRSACQYTQDYTTTQTPCLEFSRLKTEPHNL